MNPDDQLQKFISAQLDFINKRSEFLAKWVSSELEQATKYLFLANSGGAVAMLSFLGAVEKFQSSPWLRTSLVLFALGIILVGCLRAREYHRSEKIFYGWTDDVKRFISDHGYWDTMLKNHEGRIKVGCVGYVFGYGSFGCFIAGIVIGGVGLF